MLKHLYLTLFLCVPIFVFGQTVCDSVPVGSRNNLGLYGGYANDLHYSQYTNRLFFASYSAPMSIFYSDDTANTWHNAFPYDSLYYECGERGWGGSGKKVLSNKRGWTAAYTHNLTDKIGASVISFQNGDSGTWQTAMDEYLLKQLDSTISGDANSTGIGLSNYFLYSLHKNYFAIIDSANIRSPRVYSLDSIGITSYNTHKLISVAAKNDTTGFPAYLVYAKDSTEFTYNSANGVLYKFDGDTAVLVDVPDTFASVTAVFIPPQNISDDTLFVTGLSKLGTYFIYVSYDNGTSWNNISCTVYNFPLTDVEYNLNNKTTILLAATWGDPVYSKDMGKAWYPIRGAKATNLTLSSFAVAGYQGCGYGLAISSASSKLRQNLYLEAIQINDIVVSKNKTEVYLATSAGLAYTTAYKNSSVISQQKFANPYGEFPVASLVDNVIAPIRAIDIDAEDSLHLIAGKHTYVYMSFTGKDGFQQVPITALQTNSSMVMDVKFINSQVLLCVSYNGSSVKGFIHRSADGGITWSDVTPTLFKYGKCIATGHLNNDTVIYIGTTSFSNNGGALWKSTDMGISWSAINAGPTNTNDASIDSLSINSIVVDPGGTDTLYIASGNAYTNEQAFVKSTDGGLTYQYITIKDASRGFVGLEINKSNPDSEVYVSSNRHVYYYNPAIDSVTKTVSGYPGEIINTIAYGSILVGTTTGFYNLEQDNGIVTKINNSEKSNVTIAYPNPFSNYLTVETENMANSTVFIYNVIGEMVSKEIIGSTNSSITFNTKNYSPGMYFLKIVDNSNHTKEVKKLVKW